MTSLMLLLLAVFLSGCSIFDQFWDKEVLEKDGPDTVRGKTSSKLFIRTWKNRTPSVFESPDLQISVRTNIS